MGATAQGYSKGWYFGNSIATEWSTQRGAITEFEPQHTETANNCAHTVISINSYCQYEVLIDFIIHHTRFSPTFEENFGHELSTIIEVDTPATSRINNSTLPQPEANQTADDQQQRAKHAEIMDLFYKRFPAFNEYARAHNLDGSVNSSGSMLNITAAASLLLGNQFEKMLHIDESQMEALKYRSLHQSNKSFSIDDLGATSLDYNKFPSHHEYARSEPGLLDSRSIEGFQSMDIDAPVDFQRMQQRDDRNDSSLVDIVSELQKRNMLKEALALAPSALPRQRKGDTSSTSGSIDALVAELQNVGIHWASSMLKKCNETNALESSSSSADLSQNRRRPPNKADTVAMNRTDHTKATSSTSFVDPNMTTIDRTATAAKISQDSALNTSEHQPVSLKQFLARELMKHSSTSSTLSSSIDSSMMSIYLKSFVGKSSPSDPSTPAAGGRSQTLDKQRTSTPVHISSSTMARAESTETRKNSSSEALETNGDLTGKLFSGESHLSSVRSHCSDADNTFDHDGAMDEAERHKQFEALIIPAELHLNLAQQKPGSSSS